MIAMEDYVATDERPAAKCLADVASSDLYVGLIAWRYGYVPTEDNPQNRSVTEMEFRKAGELKIPRLMFLAHRDAKFPDALLDAKTGDNGAGQRVAGFRTEVERDFLVSYFKTPDHLAGLVVAAVYRHFESRLGPPRPSLRPPRLWRLGCSRSSRTPWSGRSRRSTTRSRQHRPGQPPEAPGPAGAGPGEADGDRDPAPGEGLTTQENRANGHRRR